MRLTNVSRMDTLTGRLSSYSVTVSPAEGDPLPISFDQNRHVSLGSRPGSWMAAAFFLDHPAAREEVAEAWHAVIARHGTLRTVFSWKPGADAASDLGSSRRRPPVKEGRGGGPETDLNLDPVHISPGAWEVLSPVSVPLESGISLRAHPESPPAYPAPPASPGLPVEVGSPVLTAEEVRTALRAHFDSVCDPLAAPSHRLCVVEPAGGSPPQVIIGVDHAHVDAWSLLVIIRDLTTCLADLQTGRPPGRELPTAEPFSAHTEVLEDRPAPPASLVDRWQQILAAGGGVMPQFPLPLGDLSVPRPEVVEVRDVLDPAELAAVEAHATAHGVRLISVAVSVMTALFAELGGQPLRTVFPVHSREEPRWFDSVGWFITNAVLENDDPSLEASHRAVKEAIRLGSQPLAPIMRPYGGMPAEPGMFAMSWLDHRRLPIAVDDALRPQHVSAVIRTDGVMIWFVINETGLHLRCRYPDTPEARITMAHWLDAVVERLRRPVHDDPTETT
ncbi:peptide synthetase [Nesterenkonia xinjiangensis]|uniref:Condensation domain-containing protein n=1 Tax=Nesterenkonia xinjiangensis TaxID=225327 RepID=A0A7Z0GL18_9MICC|nr:peptide synthetase [Nesterenkonia xinjiangensis]NYJ77969.1 hypothetical protein [Nesterenkonia xinjiangensis]